MVTVNDLAQASMVSQELIRHRRAITALEGNAPITSLTVGSVTVPLRDLPYPEQMGQAIRTALNVRVEELQHELEQLGVTDLEPPGPRAAPAEAAQPAAVQQPAATPAPQPPRPQPPPQRPMPPPRRR